MTSKEYDIEEGTEYDKLRFDEEYVKEFSGEARGRAFFNVSLLTNTRYKHWFKDVKRVLVVPCAAGNTVKLLRRNEFEAFGVDINPVVLRYAMEEQKPYVSEGDIRDLKFEDSSMDAVMSVYLFEHLDEKACHEAMEELMRITSDDGIIFLRISTVDGAFHGFYTDPTHINGKNRVEWDNWFATHYGDRLTLAAKRHKTEEWILIKKPNANLINDRIASIQQRALYAVALETLDEKLIELDIINKLSKLDPDDIVEIEDLEKEWDYLF